MEQRAWIKESEFVPIKNFIGEGEETTLSDSMIAKHSAVNEEAVSSWLLIKEMWNSGI